MSKLRVLICILFMGFASNALPQNFGSTPMSEEIARVIMNLDKAKFMPIREGWSFDYGFKSGYILNTFEYVRSLSTFENFQRKLPMKIFIGGPHTGSSLNLKSKYEFGRYNPEFVDMFHYELRDLLGNPDKWG